MEKFVLPAMSFPLLLLRLKIKEHPVQLEHLAIKNFRRTAKSRSGDEYDGSTQEIIKEELCAGPNETNQNPTEIYSKIQKSNTWWKS